MRVAVLRWHVPALAVAAGLAALSLPALPAAIASAAPSAGSPAVDHFNVGATHSPQLLQALAAPRSQAALVHPAASAATGSGPAALPVSPAAAAAVQGVDVASYQHPGGVAINWPQVAAAGYQFAAVKATEGNYYVNGYAAGDLAAAKAAGLSVVAYAFANPAAGSGTAAQQAQYLVSNTGLVNGVLPPLMLDIEYNPYASQETNGNSCYSLTTSAMVTWIAQFVAQVQSLTGQLPLIYTTQDWWSTCTANSTAFGQDPMWVADYTGAASPLLPAGWSEWALWQYTSGGTVPGITTSGSTDLDALNPAVVPLFAPGTQRGTAGSAVTPVTVNALTVSSSPSLAYTAAGLPPGLAISASAGQISGTPTTPGQYQVTIAAASGQATGSASFTWYVESAVTVTAPGGQSTVAGGPVDLPLTATDSAAGQSLSYSATGLPAGLSVNSHGVITGWAPQAVGTHQVTVTAADGLGGSGSASFTWSVTAAPGTGPAGPVHLDLAAKCLDDTANSSANGAKIQIWSCGTGDKSQQWTVAADQTLRIHGKCLSIAGPATAKGSKAVLEPCSGAASQQWRVATAAAIVNPVSGLCLDDPGSSKTNGAAVQIWSCASGVNQRWTLPAGPVVAQIPGKCLDDTANSTKAGTLIDLWSCNGGPAQNWTVQADGTVRVHNMCLDVYRAATVSGSRLDLTGCNGSVAQQWKVVTDGGGVELQNPHAGLCVADPGDARTNGTDLLLGVCSAADPGVGWRVR